MKRILMMLLLFLAAGSFSLCEQTYAAAKEDGGAVNRVGLTKSLQGTISKRTLVNVGQVAMWIFADGTSANTPGSNSGLFFPRGTVNGAAAIFQDGFIWGGIVNDGGAVNPRVGGQTYSIGTVPGRIITQGVAEDFTNAAVDRIWRVRKDYATANLLQDAAEINEIAAGDVTDADIAGVRAQYESDWTDWPWEKGAPWTGIDNLQDSGYRGAKIPDTDPVEYETIGANNGIMDRGEDSNANGILDDGEDTNGNNELDGEFPGIAGADQVVWTVMNDLEPSAVNSLYGSPSIGFEMQLTLWAYSRTDALGNIIFKQFRMIYKGTETTPANATIDSLYFCQWSDPDLGGAGDDFAGTDTLLSLGYAYNANSQDATYAAIGLAPPASGYDFFAGPLVDDPGGEAIFGLKKRPGKRNLPMTSFAFFAAGQADSDPTRGGNYDGTLQWWNLLRGFRPRPITPADPWTDPSGKRTFFRVPGDPTTGEGWVDENAGDRRILLVSGPFTMALGDTQETVVAVMAGLGSDRLSSVSVLKFIDRFAQEAFDLLFDLPKPPPSPKVTWTELDGQIVINWGNNPEGIDNVEKSNSKGFIFEGYNVYQLPFNGAPLSQSKRIATFDTRDNPAVISQETFDERSGQILELPVQFGRNSGIIRSLSVDTDVFREEPLVNGQKYFFGVTAYSFNPTLGQTVKTLESTPTENTVVPQMPNPGARIPDKVGGSLEITHVGTADGVVIGEIVDPAALIDATYTLEFFNDTTIVAIDSTVSDTTATVFDTTFAFTPQYDVFLNGQSVFPTRQTNLQLTGAGNLDQINFNGVIMRAGKIGFDAPTTFFATKFTFDADPSDPGLSLWGDATLFGASTGLYNEFGNGVANPTVDIAQRDIQFRFTGTSDTGDHLGVVTAGGSWATQWERGSFACTEDGGADPCSQYARVPVRIPFEIWDLENDRQINVAVINRNADGASPYGNGVGDPNTPGSEPRWRISGRDYMIPIWTDYDPDPNSTKFHNDPLTSWLLFFRQGGAATWTTGDIYTIIYANPIQPGVDKWTFSTSAPLASTDQRAKQDILDLANVFPNPYNGFNNRELSRFNRIVTFSHLPQKAVIRIFTLAGSLIKTIEKDDASQFINWDLQTEQKLPVASGIYIVHMEFPGLGVSKNLKMAIIMEQQFLRNF